MLTAPALFARILDALFLTHCAGCGSAEAGLCMACRPLPESVRQIALDGFAVEAAGRYAGALRRAILSYKSGRRDVGDALAALIADRFAASLPPKSLLVPIPTTQAP